MLDGDGNIIALASSSGGVGPDNIIRRKAWNAAASDRSAASNSEIISINNTVRGVLVNGDVRRNYIMTGATWTIRGAPPNSSNQVGTNNMNNATMETFKQGLDNGPSSTFNCFTCHGTNTTAVSHVFKDLKPLFE
jgi:hypothetical protein